jgi:flavin-dependent dehydrogenase
MDVGVVGGGIAGLVTSYYLLKNRAVSNVAIFERRYSMPRNHCTGVISLETVTRLPLASKFIENSYRNIVFFIHGIDFGIEITSDRYFACKINRVAHEIELMRFLNEVGVSINMGSEVYSINVNGKKYFLAFKKDMKEYISEGFDRIVVAEGYPPILSRRYRLKFRSGAFKALQEMVLLSNSLSDDQIETLYVFISPKLVGEGFAWLVPIDRHKVVIGYSSEYDTSIEGLERIKLVFKNLLELSYKSVDKIFGGVIVQGYPIKTISNGIIGIGDSTAMVKSISGGGLYAISIVSKLYSEIIDKNNGFSYLYSDMKRLFNTLKTQYIVRKIIWNILKTIKLNVDDFKKISRFISFNTSYLNYDRHELFLPILLIKFFNFKLKTR